MERKEKDRSCPALLYRYRAAGSTIAPATEPPNHRTCQRSVSHLSGPQLPKSKCSYIRSFFKAGHRSFLGKMIPYPLNESFEDH